MVAGLGPRAMVGARAWGAALSRPVVSLEALEDLAAWRGRGSITLAVAPAGLLTQTLVGLTRLSLRHNIIVGVVRATAFSAHRHAVLTRRSIPNRLSAYSHVAHDRRQWVAECPLYGGDAARAFAATATTQFQGAIFLQTHGNGSNLALGPLIVCSRLSSPNQVRTGGLSCFAGGPCLRGEGPLAEPDRFISPASIRADTIVLDTCWGLVPDDGLWATNTTIAHSLMSGSWTRNLLTPFSLHESSLGAIRVAIRLFQQKTSLGALCLALNRADVDAGRLPGWVLLGDPEVVSPFKESSIAGV